MDAIGRLAPQPWEKKENPQTYELMPCFGEHPKPAQHGLGLVGGNNAPYIKRFLQVETESDLRGITRPNTFCPSRQHHPLAPDTTVIQRKNPKENTMVPVYTKPLKEFQMWGYPASLAPEPLVIQQCARPEKY